MIPLNREPTGTVFGGGTITKTIVISDAYKLIKIEKCVSNDSMKKKAH
jgi:hypothetical protein